MFNGAYLGKRFADLRFAGQETYAVCLEEYDLGCSKPGVLYGEMNILGLNAFHGDASAAILERDRAAHDLDLRGSASGRSIRREVAPAAGLGRPRLIQVAARGDIESGG